MFFDTNDTEVAGGCVSLVVGDDSVKGFMMSFEMYPENGELVRSLSCSREDLSHS